MSSLLTLLVLAHGAYPLAYQIYETPSRRQQLTAATTFGLLLSDDDGQSWQWVCEEGIQYGTAPPVWWVGSNGRLLGGTFRELFSSADRGCSWTKHPEFADPPDGGQEARAAPAEATCPPVAAAAARPARKFR